MRLAEINMEARNWQESYQGAERQVCDYPVAEGNTVYSMKP